MWNSKQVNVVGDAVAIQELVELLVVHRCDRSTLPFKPGLLGFVIGSPL
jgi:hypothetical protein